MIQEILRAGGILIGAPVTLALHKHTSKVQFTTKKFSWEFSQNNVVFEVPYNKWIFLLYKNSTIISARRILGSNTAIKPGIFVFPTGIKMFFGNNGFRIDEIFENPEPVIFQTRIVNKRDKTHLLKQKNNLSLLSCQPTVRITIHENEKFTYAPGSHRCQAKTDLLSGSGF